MKTDKQAQHTALPWRVRDKSSKDYRFIIESETDEQTRGSYSGRPIAFIPRGLIAAEANASFIITAVNAHDNLVAALQAALVLCNALPDRQVEIAYKGYKDFSVRDAVQAALALAGKVGE